MAKGLIEIALQLGKQLGANTSKFLGTKSNVTFMGPGPKDGMLFQKDIIPESFASIGIEKVLPDIETSLGYAVGGKLNDIELSTLIRNLKTMDETLNPLPVTNITDMATGTKNLDQEGLASLRLMSDDFGYVAPEEAAKLKELKNINVPSNLDSLRAKSGLGERQLTEAASDVKSIDDAAAGVNQADAEGILASARVGNPFDNTPVSGNQLLDKFSEIKNRPAGLEETGDVTGIMQTIDKVDLPGKRAASREFLVNSLKVGDDYPSTTLTDVMSAQDMKYVMEGGGGVMGDPIVLVQKYFGPRIAEMVPTGGTAEEISIFTRRVMDNVEDAKGLRPDEPNFDPLTAKFVDNLADGGIAGLDTRQGLRFGGKAAKNILSKIDDTMIKKAADDIFPTDDYKYDAELVVDALVENNPKIFKNLLADDLDDALRSELYGLAVSETGTRAAMKIKAGKMERPLFDENGKLNKDAVLADASKYGGLDGKRKSIIPDNEYVQVKKDFNQEILGKAPTPRFQLNVDKAVSELNIPREEAIRIAQLPSDQQKLALQRYMDMDTAQRAELMNYNPKTFDAAKGGLAKILEL